MGGTAIDAVGPKAETDVKAAICRDSVPNCDPPITRPLEANSHATAPPSGGVFAFDAATKQASTSGCGGRPYSFEADRPLSGLRRKNRDAVTIDTRSGEAHARYRTDQSALAEQRSSSEFGTPPIERLFDRIQHWSAGAEIYAGGPSLALLSKWRSA
jgi:hypothetical protein